MPWARSLDALVGGLGTRLARGSEATYRSKREEEPGVRVGERSVAAPPGDGRLGKDLDVRVRGASTDCERPVRRGGCAEAFLRPACSSTTAGVEDSCDRAALAGVSGACRLGLDLAFEPGMAKPARSKRPGVSGSVAKLWFFGGVAVHIQLRSDMRAGREGARARGATSHSAQR